MRCSGPYRLASATWIVAWYYDDGMVIECQPPEGRYQITTAEV